MIYFDTRRSHCCYNNNNSNNFNQQTLQQQQIVVQIKQCMLLRFFLFIILIISISIINMIAMGNVSSLSSLSSSSSSSSSLFVSAFGPCNNNWNRFSSKKSANLYPHHHYQQQQNPIIRYHYNNNNININRRQQQLPTLLQQHKQQQQFFQFSPFRKLSSNPFMNLHHNYPYYRINNNKNMLPLFMHMNHHHDHNKSSNNNNNNNNNQIDPITGTAAIVQSQSHNQNNIFQFNIFKNTIIRRRRLIAMIVFCAIAIIGPSIIPILFKQQQLKTISTTATNTNTIQLSTRIVTFMITSTILIFAETIRNSILQIIQRIKNITSHISKHSTPITTKSIFNNQNAADRITLLGGAINIILSISKFIIGITCHSSALIADAGHSLSDLFSDFVTLWAVQVARLPPDQDHPYGHGKFEAIGSLFLSLTLIGTAIGIGIMSNNNLLDILAIQRRTAATATATAGTALSSSLQHQYPIPSYPALIMAFISVVSKEWLFRITRVVGQRLQSQVVIANAWHHRTDAYSSILSSASIALAMFVPGLLFVDAAAGLFVAAMIGMTGMEILGESVKQLTDTSNEALVQKVIKVANDNVDVDQVVRVRARQVGSVSTVDISVTMPEDRTASAARAVEERLKQQILQSTIDENVIDVDVRATAPNAILTSSSTATTTLDTDTINGDDTTKMSLTIDPVSSTPNTRNDVSTETTPATTTTTSTTINTIDTLMTVEEVESYIRNEILVYHSNTIVSVSGITVYYRDILLKMIDVDVHVKLVQQQQDNNSSTTIAKTNPIPIRIETIDDATILCNTIRQTILQNSKQITNAKVYIDLN